MPDWEDQVVIVTGSSAGLGLAVGSAFAKRGARVVLAARSAERLAAAVDDDKTGNLVGIAADVTKQADVDHLVGQAIGRFGRLDVLVNNVGRSARAELLNTTPEQFQELIDINLLTAVRCTRAGAPHLIAARGHVVNIGSLAAKCAARYLGAYPASKFALAAYTQQLRMELGPRGLHVLLVCPGPIDREEARLYDATGSDLPASAHRPGGGAKLRLLSADYVAERIVRACQRRQPELVLPARARLLFAISQLYPSLGDWLLGRMT